LNRGNELDKVIIEQKHTILHENDIFKGLVQAVSSGQSIAIGNSYKEVKLHIAETQLAIEEKRTAITDLEEHREELTDVIETEEHYRKVLTPEYLNRIYHTFKGARQDGGSEALGLYMQMVEKHGQQKATNMIVKDPSIVGALKGWGVGRVLGISNARKDAIALCQNLRKQLEGFNSSQEMVKKYKAQMQEMSFESKIFALNEEIEQLRTLLPADIDQDLLEIVGNKLKSGKGNNIDWRELQRSELFEAVRIGQYSEKKSHIIGNDEVELDKTNVSAAGQVSTLSQESQTHEPQTQSFEVTEQKLAIKKAVVKEKNSPVEAKKDQEFSEKGATSYQQSLGLERTKPKAPRASLTFAEVKSGLNKSIVTEIFHQYIAAINSKDPVEKNSQMIKAGSVHMSLLGNKVGLWTRFSDGSSGDIFSFVEAATGCSKYEALEIVASHAGISAKDNKLSLSPRGLVSPMAKDNQELTHKENKDQWIAESVVSANAPGFNPEQDLSFLIKKGNVVRSCFEYRNIDNKLLGYAVRIEDSNSGDKQVLPVAYCHNEALGKSCWKLKGFSDAGTKPIYGAHKLSGHLEKPVLIVEGEKTADAATKLLPDYNVISWMGGAQSVDKVDWSKLAGKVVSIWPDNDKPGIEAARNIANNIDVHNGFAGFVSIVETKELGLPEKWDLADEIPKSALGINPSKIIETSKSSAPTIGQRLEIAFNKSNPQQKLLAPTIDMLIAQGKIDKDEYVSKEMYIATLASLAQTKGINLSKDVGVNSFVDGIRELQDEYKNLHRNFKQNQLTGKEYSASSAEDFLKQELVRDVSILHMSYLGISRIPKTHAQYIEQEATEVVTGVKHFNDSDKEHVANNMYKTINTSQWTKGLDARNQDAKKIKLDIIQESHDIKTTIDNALQQRQKSKTVDQALEMFKTQQSSCAEIYKGLKYPESHDQMQLKQLELAGNPKSLQELEKLTQYLQKSSSVTDDTIKKSLQTAPHSSIAHNELLNHYHEHTIGLLNKYVKGLQDGKTISSDNKKFSCPVEYMDHVIKSKTSPYMPHLEIKQIQQKVVEHQKQLTLSKDMDLSL
jgi:hypothetical protein